LIAIFVYDDNLIN